MENQLGSGDGLLQEVVVFGVQLMEKGKNPGRWDRETSIVVNLWEREVEVALDEDGSGGIVRP